MANLSKDDVLKLARLSRLELSEEEIKEFQQELSQILDYVEQLQSADTEGLLPTYQVTGLVNVDRNDVIKDYGYEPGELLKNVPKVKNNQIQVKRMVG
jgi:aspartyl-tRNA(Asn)/glutamyl-tRNA(Gln) amidotransferase subunit C